MPSVQLALRANFVQLLQFCLFFSVHISFPPLPLSVGTFALSEILFRQSRYNQNKLIHVVFTNERFLEVAIEKRPKWDLNTRSQDSFQML